MVRESLAPSGPGWARSERCTDCYSWSRWVVGYGAWYRHGTQTSAEETWRRTSGRSQTPLASERRGNGNGSFGVVETMASGRRPSVTELDGVAPPHILPVTGCVGRIHKLMRIYRSRCKATKPARLATLTKSQSSEGQRLFVVASSFCEKITTCGVFFPVFSCTRLVCHCRLEQTCHADSIISVYRDMFPEAYDRDDEAAAAPSAEVLNRLTSLREEPDSDEKSTAVEGAPARGGGWISRGLPVQIWSEYTSRDVCDGQSPASPGRWPVENRRYPEHGPRLSVSSLSTDFSRRVGTPALLISLELGKISECPFAVDDIEALKKAVADALSLLGPAVEGSIGS